MQGGNRCGTTHIGQKTIMRQSSRFLKVVDQFPSSGPGTAHRRHTGGTPFRRESTTSLCRAGPAADAGQTVTGIVS